MRCVFIFFALPLLAACQPALRETGLIIVAFTPQGEPIHCWEGGYLVGGTSFAESTDGHWVHLTDIPFATVSIHNGDVDAAYRVLGIDGTTCRLLEDID